VSEPEPCLAYVICDNPTGFPGQIVVRTWEIKGFDLIPRETVYVGASLDEARQVIPRDLVPFSRHESDEKSIVETWI